jgi:hypothetical protein
MRKHILRFGLLCLATVTMADSCDPPAAQGSFSLEKDIDGATYPTAGIQMEFFNFECPNCGWRGSFRDYREEVQAKMQTFVAAHRVVKVNTFRSPRSGTLRAAEVYYVPGPSPPPTPDNIRSLP